MSDDNADITEIAEIDMLKQDILSAVATYLSGDTENAESSGRQACGGEAQTVVKETKSHRSVARKRTREKKPTSILGKAMPSANSSEKTDTTLVPTANDIELVSKAVKSLYDDGIEPDPFFITLIRKRLKELEGQYWDLARIRAACKAAGVDIQPQVTNSGREVDSVDPSVSVSYPDCIWDELGTYFESDAFHSSPRHPTSNYELACILHENQIAGLEKYRLGEVRHIVKMCIEKRLLGYQKNGSQSRLVPYAQSDECKRFQEGLTKSECRRRASAESSRVVNDGTASEQKMTEKETVDVNHADPVGPTLCSEMTRETVEFREVRELEPLQKTTDVSHTDKQTAGFEAKCEDLKKEEADMALSTAK